MQWAQQCCGRAALRSDGCLIMQRTCRSRLTSRRCESARAHTGRAFRAPDWHAERRGYTSLKSMFANMTRAARLARRATAKATLDPHWAVPGAAGLSSREKLSRTIAGQSENSARCAKRSRLRDRNQCEVALLVPGRRRCDLPARGISGICSER